MKKEKENEWFLFLFRETEVLILVKDLVYRISSHQI